MSQDISAAPSGFEGLSIAPTLLSILTKHGYSTPTPIQHQSIPVAITGSDVIGIAQTGTGKTLAFGIPMIQRLAQFKGRGLVILPTRELALQVEENLKKIGGSIGMRTVVLIGGASMHMQKLALQKNPHVIIATPGRLIDHMEQKTISLKDVKVLVLDEADRMLDMGFAPQINKILDVVPRDRQTMLFSATMPLEIVRIANSQMRTPVRIEVAPQGTSSERIEQEIFFIAKHDKDRLLELCLKETEGTALVFTRTKYGAKKVARIVRAMGHTADELHANRSLAQRKAALEGFKTGKYRVLVATDIAARGIDVKGIALVVNYDLPDNSEDYVHRIGRTGRAGLGGKAVSFATHDQRGDVKSIERLIRKMIPIKPVPALPAPRYVEAPERDVERVRTPRPMRGGTPRPASGGREVRYAPSTSPAAPRASTPSAYAGSASPSRGGAPRKPYAKRAPYAASAPSAASASPSPSSNQWAGVLPARKFKK